MLRPFHLSLRGTVSPSVLVTTPNLDSTSRTTLPTKKLDLGTCLLLFGQWGSRTVNLCIIDTQEPHIKVVHKMTAWSVLDEGEKKEDLGRKVTMSLAFSSIS